MPITNAYIATRISLTEDLCKSSILFGTFIHSFRFIIYSNENYSK